MRSAEETSIKLSGSFEASALGMAVRGALMRALAIDTKLPEWLITMSGMSGKKYRYFVNGLIEAMQNPAYLEVGSYSGSTACSAISGNTLSAFCIDNWSLFGGPKNEFDLNIKKVMADKIDFNFLEADFRQVEYEKIGKYNVYLFDGPHEEKDQFDGIVCAQSALDESYILIVDDYNWLPVRAGTQGAIASLGLEVECAVEIRTTQDDTHPALLAMEKSDWHNGYYIAVCKKSKGR